MDRERERGGEGKGRRGKREEGVCLQHDHRQYH